MSWIPTDTYGEWGQIRVVVAGVDVTWFRDVETKVQGWQLADPYGPLDATIVFPQVTAYDDLTDPDLVWLREGAPVRIDHIAADAVVDANDPPFSGLIDSVTVEDVVTVTCKGFFAGRLATYAHQPSITPRESVDAGRKIWHIVGNRGHWVLHPRHGLVTGIEVQARGSRDMTALGMVDHVLGLTMTEDGDSATLLPDPSLGPKAIRMQWRELKETPDATVHAGAHGVKVSLRRDLVDMTTAVYGEGVSPNGERWRNAKYPNLGTKVVPTYPGTLSLGDTDDDTGNAITVMVMELWGNGTLSADDEQYHEFTAAVEQAVRRTQAAAGLSVTGTVNSATWSAIFASGTGAQSFSLAHFEPLAADPRTERFLRSGDGTLMGYNPVYDLQVPLVHQFIGYGEGVTKATARANARAVVNRAASWSGTVTLTSDPEEMSKLDLRAGMTLQVEHHGGAGGRKLYVSSVQVDWSSATKPVTLAVSTTARHYLDLLTLNQRRMEARQDPAKQWRHQLRRSAQTSDAIIGWEGESGAGIVRRTALTRGWNTIPMVACELGTMGQIRLSTSPNRPFIMGVFADRVYPRVLQRRLGNPFTWRGSGDDKEDVWTHHAEWLVRDERLLVEAWGDPDQPCGFWPHRHTNDEGKVTGFAPTGNFRDDGSWDFATVSGFLWLAVYVKDPCSIVGRARISLNDAP